MAEFKLPDLGEGVTEDEVDRWLVAEGDAIAEDDPLVELITDKATAEVPSPFAGVVSKIHVSAGEIVPVGTVLVTIDSDSEAPQSSEPPPRERTPNESTSSAAASGNGETASTRSVPLGGTRSAEVRDTTGVLPTPPREDSAEAREDSGVKAMPPVRRLARELGVDLAAVSGTGPDGAIVRSDVIGASASGSGAASAPSPAVGGRREALRGVRRIIAERMTHAHQTIPPVTHVEECDVTELDATRKLANERAPDHARLTFLPFIVKAVVQGLKDHPALNATLD
ncbi:MAG: dihydrolipoamide acetyltransferase family protein, partial [Actinomycetota bacterium]